MAAKNWSEVLEYAESVRSGQKIACIELRQAAERFFRDLDNPDYEIDYNAPEFCIGMIEKTLCHQQGEALDGTPLRGKPFILQPFQKFIIYNLLGFKLFGTDIVRFHEALIYIPRKNGENGICCGFGLGPVPLVSTQRIQGVYYSGGSDAVARIVQLHRL